MRSKTNDAQWLGVVETLDAQIKVSAAKCGLSFTMVKRMRAILYGTMNATNRMRPPVEIMAAIPYVRPDENPDVRAAAAREVTAEAAAARLINETSPVVTKKRKHKSRMTVENLIYIAKNIHKYPTELGATLGHSPMMVAHWKEILTGELDPGPRRYNQVSLVEIRQIQTDFQTIPVGPIVPVAPLLHGHSKMTLEVLIAIAKTMDRPAREIGIRLSMSTNTVIAWRQILRGWSEPGPQQRARVPVEVISQVQQDYQTISAMPEGAESSELSPESEQVMAESLSSATRAAAVPDDPAGEAAAIVEDMLALAERIELLVPAFEEARDAKRRLEIIKTSLNG